MANQLIHENSPYLLQHADNPVDWYPWAEVALEKAQSEDKPIFLSIGYTACHWCHVMAHETFEDPEIAAIMNKYFINIKVDREERPDLDSIYMSAVVAMTGQGGWPMSVFLTPDGQPFFGGTYFPPARRYGMPSFREVLQGVTDAWQNERSQLLQAGEELTQHLQNQVAMGNPAQPLSEKILEEAALNLVHAYDWSGGGWGSAPKFPQPMAIEFLLLRSNRGDKSAHDIAMHVLLAMARGGMYDVVGGGFARYSTDNKWLVPHFEKMLYDNAQLARVYLHAYLVTGEPAYKGVCEETLNFIVRELMDRPEIGDRPHGGFYSSLDADSEGEEGKYYLWTPAEIRAALGNEFDAKLIIDAFGVSDSGNFEGYTVLQRALTDETIAERNNLSIDKVQPYLDNLLKRLLAVRQLRTRPNTDDKVLVAWNALALAAFAEAARYLKRQDYLEVAKLNADFLLTELNPQDSLKRSWRNGQAQHPAYLEDYAALILGLLALYQSDPDPWWFSSAIQLFSEIMEHFQDPNGGFFDTRDDLDHLITRPKDIQDNATPSGNALTALAMLQLSTYTGNIEWRNQAEMMLSSVQDTAVKYPTSFSEWLCAADLVIHPPQEVAILGEPDHQNTRALVNALWSVYRPGAVSAISSYPPAPNSPPLLLDRPLLDNLPTAYVCQNFVCLKPVNSIEEFISQLR
jgi:uncharacterized protein